MPTVTGLRGNFFWHENCFSHFADLNVGVRKKISALRINCISAFRPGPATSKSDLSG